MSISNAKLLVTPANVIEGIDKVAERVYDVYNGLGVSLPQYTSKTHITSRVFIDENIADEPIVPDILNVVHQLYCAYILTALQLDQMIGSYKVKELLEVVATANFESIEDALQNFGNIKNSFEDIQDSDAQNTAADIIGTIKTIGSIRDNAKKRSTTKQSIKPHATGSVTFNDKNDLKLPFGKVIEVVFGAGENALKVNILVQLFPTIITSAVADAFLKLNFTPSMAQRWFQWKAGEISFFKDFIYASDLRKARKKAMIEDKTGILYEMLSLQDNALSKAYAKYRNVAMNSSSGKNRQNIANTVLMFDYQNFQRAQTQVGVNLDNISDRERFFARTFAMIVVVVNTLQNQVIMYFHGLKDKAVYTYNQIKYNSKGNKMDTLGILEAYAKGLIPKL